MGKIRVEYIIFAFGCTEETVEYYIDELEKAIIQEERLKQLGINLQ